MARKPIPQSTETAVLLQCRRRCCICFGLDRDARLKAGQIAHLDRDSSNPSEDNLAFLCFDHHDEYDSRSSQRKNLSLGEVKEFRRELRQTINKGFSQPVHFGEISTPPADPYAGTWIRLGGETNSAELTLTPLPDSQGGDVQYYVSGLALWGGERAGGPNLGTLDFLGTMSDARVITHRRRRHGDAEAITILTFGGGGLLEVEENDWFDEYGINVNFIGTYRRAR